MSYLKALVVFFSMSGRTRAVAQAIAAELRDTEVDVEELKYNGKTSDLMKEQEGILRGDLSRFTFKREILDLTGYDRIFFGTPTHGVRPAAAFSAFVADCKNGSGKDWVLFATCRAMGGKIFDRMRTEIEKKGGKVVGQRLFKGFLGMDVKKARVFGQSFN